MDMGREIFTPLSDEVIKSLRAGETVYITGFIYTARDAAHKRMAALPPGDEPFVYAGAAVYYAGPCPARPGRVIGSVGPTTSGRMDAYAPALIERGLKVMIGKGLRSAAVKDAIVRYGGVYLAAVGGAGALLSQRVTEATPLAFEDLGAEAVYRLRVERFPAIVAADCAGNDVYDIAISIETGLQASPKTC